MTVLNISRYKNGKPIGRHASHAKQFYAAITTLFEQETPYGGTITKVSIESDDAASGALDGGAASWAYYPIHVDPRDAEVDAIVHKGAEFLDIYFGAVPWRNNTFFDISNGAQCVLAQTAVLAHLDIRSTGWSGFSDHIIALGITTDGRFGQWFAERGFVCGTADLDPVTTATYAELERAWERLLFS
jgi:hypothetical protein